MITRYDPKSLKKFQVGNGEAKASVDGPEFDPEGDGYDYKTAKARGYGPDGTGENAGHWPSRDAETGMQLKGRAHPTWNKAIEEDTKLGYRLEKRGGRYYTVK